MIGWYVGDLETWEYNAAMTVLNAHFVGKRLVLDDPVPENLPENAVVRVVVEPAAEQSALDKIAAMASPLALPRDFSLNHKHYLKGMPKR